MRNFLILLIGLIIGVAGAILIRDSILPAEGTPEARILALEEELKDTRMRLAMIDPAMVRPRGDTGHAVGVGVRGALDDLKSGRPVDMNHLFNATKPLLRDLSPLFDNIRRKEERRSMEYLAGEYTRKYDLNSTQQAALKEWLKNRSEQNAALFKAVVLADGTRLDDLVKASKFDRKSNNVDGFMEQQLTGAKLTAYRRDRLEERAQQVQNEADRKVERLNNTVQLDERQQDQVFSIMARSSPEYDAQMMIEGVETSATTEGSAGPDRDAAIMEVLRPDQQQKYTQYQEERRAKMEMEFTEMGLKIPEGFDALNDD